MATDKLILIGGGEHARVVLDVLLECGAQVLGLYDPKFSGTLFGVPLLGAYRPEEFPEAKAIVAIGNNATRKRVAATCAHAFGFALHPSALVSKFSTVGQGCMVFHKAVIQAQACIGNHVIVNTGAQVDHDCVLGDFVHLAPSATLCGTVLVGEGTLVGAGATVIPGIKIGKWATIGAGSVVTENIPDYALAVGVPAKVIKIQTPSQ